MKFRTLISILSLVIVAAISPAFAQEAAVETDILNAVHGFYEWMQDYTETDETGHFRNLVVDRAYRNSEYLTPSFISAIDRLASESLHYDPFTCAQDFYHRLDAQIIEATDEQATVMLMTYFGSNPYPHNFTAQLARDDGDWKIDAIICRENFTPEGVVRNFYQWYLDYGRTAGTGDFGDPLLDGAYRDYEYLEPDFVQAVDALVEEMTPGAPDPFLGTQDRPVGISVDAVSAGETAATVMVHSFFPGNRERHHLLAELSRREDSWVISNIIPEATPEATALVFYNQYMTYKRYDMENGLDQIPILHWGGRWQDYLTVELILSLIHTYTADEPMLADPVLCAQDIPTRVTAETVDRGDTFARIHIYGEYPAGPDTFTTYPLATAYADLVHGQWQLSYIGCGEQ